MNMNNIIHAFKEDGNVMVMIRNVNVNKVNYDEGEKVHQANGHKVDILPKTHELYQSVVEKFNL